MGRVKVSTVIDVPPSRVWDDVRDLSSHVEWMDDALGIHFTSLKTSGVGAAYDCDTAVGPFHLTDRIEVTDWQEGRRIGIRHRGMVRGTGHFTIRRASRGRTRFTWEEHLSFPWWLGGGLGSLIGGRFLKRVWRRNLANLRDRLET
jgi:polyketide cyclase/dehydrase/lipid transport protein